MLVSETLTRALELIDQYGWGQHRRQCADGRICITYAVQLAAEECPEVARVTLGRALSALIFAADCGDLGGLVGWNDTAWRTLDEVRDAITTAVDDERQIEAQRDEEIARGWHAEVM